MRDSILRLAEVVGDLTDSEEATGLVRMISCRLGRDLSQEVRDASGVGVLARPRVSEALVDLHGRLEGDFVIEEQDDEKIVLSGRECPFGDRVLGRPALCQMTACACGTVAAENLGYGKVVLERTIAQGDPECRVVVYVQPTAEAQAAEGSVYEPSEFLRLRLAERNTQVEALQAEIAARVASEQKLRATEDRLSALLAMAPDPTISVDHEGRVTLFNQAAERTFGYEREEIIGRPLDVLLPESFASAHRGHMEEFARGDDVSREMGARLRICGRRKDGNEFPAEGSISHMELDGKTLFTVILRDVSDTILREEALRQSQRMEAVGQLAGGVAHDFNNLLTVIRGRSELLLTELEAPELRFELEQINQAADHAASLTHQLLAFSRRQVLTPRVMHLGSIVSGLYEMVRRLTPENIELETRVASPLSAVRVDRTQVEQVILNLVVNARDAMADGGTLTIDVRDVDLTPRFVRQNMGSRAGPHVLLSIRDTGTGMDAATQSRIFEPFFTTKEGSRGTGLGLATVYGIVKQSGGYIRVVSDLGEGTTFGVYFPSFADESEDTTDPDQPDETRPPRRSGRILLVEDDVAVRKLTLAFLVRAGHEVLEAEDCADAIRICRELPEPVDLLITDVVMPDMSGPELAQRLTALHPDLKTLLVSGYMDETPDQFQALTSSTPFLAKPFTLDALTRRVQDILTGVRRGG